MIGSRGGLFLNTYKIIQNACICVTLRLTRLEHAARGAAKLRKTLHFVRQGGERTGATERPPPNKRPPPPPAVNFRRRRAARFCLARGREFAPAKSRFPTRRSAAQPEHATASHAHARAAPARHKDFFTMLLTIPQLRGIMVLSGGTKVPNVSQMDRVSCANCPAHLLTLTWATAAV